jgi:hypothetical protein
MVKSMNMYDYGQSVVRYKSKLFLSRKIWEVTHVCAQCKNGLQD